MDGLDLAPLWERWGGTPAQGRGRNCANGPHLPADDERRGATVSLLTATPRSLRLRGTHIWTTGAASASSSGTPRRNSRKAITAPAANIPADHQNAVV